MGFLQQFKSRAAIAGFTLQFSKADARIHLIRIAAPGEECCFQFGRGAGGIKLPHSQAQFHAASDRTCASQAVAALDRLTIGRQRILDPAIGFGDHAAGKLQAGVVRIGITQAVGCGQFTGGRKAFHSDRDQPLGQRPWVGEQKRQACGNGWAGHSVIAARSGQKTAPKRGFIA